MPKISGWRKVILNYEWVIWLFVFISVFSFISFSRSNYDSRTNVGISTDLDTYQTITKSPSVTPTPTVEAVPRQYQISGGDHFFQTFNNCGPTSLSMTLSFYDINVSQAELGDFLRPYQITNGDNDDKSVTLTELAEKSKEYGFTPYHRPGGNIKLLKKFISNDIPVITRTLTRVGEDIGHYRVIFGYDDTQIIQNDSLQGRNLKYLYQDFDQIWRPYGYEYLVLVPAEKLEIAESILGEELDNNIAWQNAVDRLEVESEANPEDSLLAFSLSVAYYNVGEYQKSVETFEAVEEKLPFRTIWYQIEPLLAYQQLGMYEKLLPRIEKILVNDNRAFSELYQIRGEIYLERGEVGRAKQEFAQAVRYNRNFKPAIDALNNIKAI